MSIDSEHHRDDAQQPTTWNPMAYALLRSRHLIVFAMMIGAACGFVFGALQPNQYASNGKLLVRPGVREAATPEAGVTESVDSRLTNPREAVANELKILSDPALIKEVVRIVGPERILASYDPAASDTCDTPLFARWLHAFQSWWFAAKGEDASRRPSAEGAAAAVRAGLVLKAEPTGSIIDVDYTTHSPQAAHDVINAFLKVAVSHHQKVFNVGGWIVGFLTEQEASARQACKTANKALAEFQIEHELFDLEAERKNLIGKLAELQGSLESDSSEIEGLNLRLDYVEKQLAAPEETPLTETRLLNAEYTRLQQQLSSLLLRKLDLEQRSGETSTEFKSRERVLVDLIDSTRKQLEVQPMFLEQDTRRRELMRNRDGVKESIALIEGTLGSRRERLVSLRTQLVELERLKPQYLELALEAEQCKQRADVFATASEKFDMIGLLDRAEMSNLRVVQQGNMPGDKVGPNRFRLLIMAIMLGTLCGIALAIWRGATDPVIRRGMHVAKLGCPLLAVVREGPRKSDPLGDHPFPALRETTELLWSKLALEVGRESEAKVAFIAATEGDGTTVVATCTAIGLAQHLREPVVLVETGFHSPRLIDYLDLAEGPGLAEVLRDEVPLSEALQQTRFPELSVIGAGSGAMPEPGIFASEHGYNVLRELAKGRRYVLFDLAPPTGHPDSRLLLWDADAVVAVVRAGTTRADDARQLIQTIRDAKTKLLGTVLNRYRPMRPFLLPEPRWVSALENVREA